MSNSISTRETLRTGDCFDPLRFWLATDLFSLTNPEIPGPPPAPPFMPLEAAESQPFYVRWRPDVAPSLCRVVPGTRLWEADKSHRSELPSSNQDHPFAAHQAIPDLPETLLRLASGNGMRHTSS